MHHLTLHGAPRALQWAALLGVTVLLVAVFRLIGLPAALLLGAMGAAIIVASSEGRIKIPAGAFIAAQGVVGCLVAEAVGASGATATILREWPIFLTFIGAVIAISAAQGLLLARWKILPGTTAIWGTSPGAATAMVLMAEAFGADIRLVAVMQYLRVAFVGLVASVVARTFAGASAPAAVATDWFPPLDFWPFVATLALAFGGAVVGAKSKIPAGALLVPLGAGAGLSAAGAMAIDLPPWLLAAAYALIGWSIGLRFTRPIVAYAATKLPRIVASIFVLIAICGGLGFALHAIAGTDALTAYLATSPGGADSVAIIAASSKVDLPFVMAMQIARALLVMAIGPSLARYLARRTGE
jgi:uncharacterized protein